MSVEDRSPSKASLRILTTSSVARFYTVPSLLLLKTSMLEYTLSLLLSVPFENPLNVDSAKLLLLDFRPITCLRC
jgi:hypothetical protein